MVNSEGQVKIADFGVGCKLQETLGVADSFVGTVTYMDVRTRLIRYTLLTEPSPSIQPGRISGQPHTTNSDVWSLGLTIMECALGCGFPSYFIRFVNLPPPPQTQSARYYPYTPPGQNSNPSFFELHERIVEQPPPTLPTDTFGEDFCNFISIWYLCNLFLTKKKKNINTSFSLCKNTTRRPYAPDLLVMNGQFRIAFQD